ncbi:hypothetical protein HOA93_01120 [bacterium]|jgi:hypothetical protein|nr:hypothetical protein [bacterium]
MTNKIGNNRYFLILDYDDFDESNFNEIKEEITSLIQKFNLSDADIYKTQS